MVLAVFIVSFNVLYKYDYVSAIILNKSCSNKNASDITFTQLMKNRTDRIRDVCNSGEHINVITKQKHSIRNGVPKFI